MAAQQQTYSSPLYITGTAQECHHQLACTPQALQLLTCAAADHLHATKTTDNLAQLLASQQCNKPHDSTAPNALMPEHHQTLMIDLYTTQPQDHKDKAPQSKTPHTCQRPSTVVHPAHTKHRHHSLIEADPTKPNGQCPQMAIHSMHNPWLCDCRGSRIIHHPGHNQLQVTTRLQQSPRHGTCPPCFHSASADATRDCLVQQ
jgi:hypothetical protein